MLVVQLFKQEAGRREEVGRLEFFGVPLGEPSTGALVDFALDEGKRGEGQVRLLPPGIASNSEIKAIAASLCHNVKKGTAGRYTWELSASKP